ncbi:hypothetical protein [Plasticicumulans sp.]|uniref:hypothetical protein n=1 Tax=Plasticicumulans sp. TaxID=2307179 RepID=UPI00393BE5C7
MINKKKTPKQIVEYILKPARAKSLFTANYLPALPFTPQNFEIGSILPAMLYMARWGHRRGKGKFSETFGQEEKDKKGLTKTAVNLINVTTRLLDKGGNDFEGFDDQHGKTMLADLLLTYCLENKDHEIGHHEQVQRVFPTHYFSSWLDLPKDVGNLRGVPELLTALLAWQNKGDVLTTGGEKTSFAVGAGNFSTNPLLALFAHGMTISGPHASNLASDQFLEDENGQVSIDELLAVRLAQTCGYAPEKAGKGKGESANIPNRWPIANTATKYLRSDLSTFIKVYGHIIPRQTFLPMLEANIGLGMTNLLLSTTACLFNWEATGTVSDNKSQWPLFVDCSHGLDKRLRHISEVATSEVLTRYERMPILLMLLRVLDDRVRFDHKLRHNLPSIQPDSSDWLNLLGDIYQRRHERADTILNGLDEDCFQLANEFEAESEEPEVVRALRADNINPALRLAEALVDLHGSKLQREKFSQAMESSLMPNRPNGLAFKRRSSRNESGTKKSIDLRSIVFSHALLDFLVHRHLCKDGKGNSSRPLSLLEFLKILKDHYGLYVDREPPGLAVPQELLRENRLWLERRLRDLGLLVGVNDAESMKQLRARFTVANE